MCAVVGCLNGVIMMMMNVDDVDVDDNDDVDVDGNDGWCLIGV